MKSENLLQEHNSIVNETIDGINADNRSIETSHLLGTLRHLIEHVMLVIYCRDNGKDCDDSWANLEPAIAYVSNNPKYRILSDFHKLHLQKMVSHKIPGKEFSEIVFINYIQSLIKIKDYVKKSLNIEILESLNNYPKNLDTTFFDYYKKILSLFNSNPPRTYLIDSLYYIQKKKPIIINGESFYELTLSPANDSNEKFDRFVAFSKGDIFENYAIKATIYEVDCLLFDKTVPVRIIENYSISIRQCEFKKFASILGIKATFSKENKEYVYLMRLLTTEGFSLNHLVSMSKQDFNTIKENAVKFGAKALNIFGVLEKCRIIINEKKPGFNVLSFLLFSMNNVLISKQLSNEKNAKLSNLYLSNGCIPFDQTPFSANLIKSKHLLKDLINCIGLQDHEDELIARLISTISATTGQIYIDEKEFCLSSSDIDSLLKIYNRKIPDFQAKRRINRFKTYLYLEENEALSLKIISKLKKYTNNFVPNYSTFANNWVVNHATEIKGNDKIEAFKNCFSSSTLFFVFGAAGTGKSTLINYVLDLFSSSSKICLATTNPAVENLKRKINAKNCTFQTIASFNSPRNENIKYDILVVDECSIVSNFDMNKVLDKIDCKMILLCGDLHQLSSIDFGNWFSLSRELFSQQYWVELTSQFRTSDNDLVELWDKVRNYDKSTLEFITNKKYQNKLDSTLFKKIEEDEIILCLNYDGLYGINSINKYLQVCNGSTPVRWYQYIFKKDDPILFFDSTRFNGIFYNNLKGKILNVYKDKDKITFEVRIFSKIKSVFFNTDLEILDNSNSEYDDVRFSVYSNKTDDYDNDTAEIHLIPFQIAYAVSIHKAQGLEYDSVKVVLTNEIEEKIDHNIFYTAITRAKKALKIFWSPETGSKILENIQNKKDKKDVSIFKSKNSLIK